MNRVLKGLINVYHLVFVSRVATCRYTPSCSQYLNDSVEKHGTIKGLLKSLQRVMSCHPFSNRQLYDPA